MVVQKINWIIFLENISNRWIEGTNLPRARKKYRFVSFLTSALLNNIQSCDIVEYYKINLEIIVFKVTL